MTGRTTSMGYILWTLIILQIMSYGVADRRENAPILKDFATRKDFLDYITDDLNFENKVPPDYDHDIPTVIECQMHVENFDSINEANMEFTVTLLLHLSWYDARFSMYNIKNIKDGYVEIDAKNLEKLWVPDIYFPNEKNAYYHNVLMPNKMLRIYEGGEVSYSTRLSLTLSCPMDFRHYPFDKQTCKILVESFSYNDGNIVLKWSNSTNSDDTKNEAVIFDENAKSLPQFEILNTFINQSSRARRGLGNHSCLMVEFHLVRNIGYYLVQMYIPSLLVVMLSWISFWLNVGAVPGRISLGVLTVLTMTTQSSDVNATLPHVSYTKAIDIWMSTCLMFVFFALIEFAVANVLMRKDTNKGFKFTNMFNIPKSNKKKEQTNCEKNPLNKEMFTKTYTNDDTTRAQEGEEGNSTHAPVRKKKVNKGVIYAMYCDVGSRIAFPACFAIFNICYWSYFLIQLNKPIRG